MCWAIDCLAIFAAVKPNSCSAAVSFISRPLSGATVVSTCRYLPSSLPAQGSDEGCNCGKLGGTKEMLELHTNS